MKNFLFCRRTFIATFAVGGVIAIGCYTKDVKACWALAAISTSLSAANSYEKSNVKR